MSSNSLIKQAKLKNWSLRISDQKTSGLSVTEWCSQNNVSKNMFFYWKRKLKDEAISQMIPEIVPLSMPAPIPTLTEESCTTCATFKPASCARIYINGISIEIDSSASDSFITTLIKAVRNV